jgi:trimeric autotransporter adhesin
MKQRILPILAASLLAIPVMAQNDIIITSPTPNAGNRNSLILGLGAASAGSGLNNVILGNSAGGSVSNTGSSNVMVGVAAGFFTRSGSSNVFMGYEAAKSNYAGGGNVISGYQAGYTNNASNNVFAGYQAGYTNSSGFGNVFTGFQTGYTNASGNGNVFTGAYAGNKNATGSNNLFDGYQAGQNNQAGNNSVLLGFQTGMNAQSDFNTFAGFQAGMLVTTGRDNTYFGAGAGSTNVIGNHNTFVGRDAGASAKDTDDNVYVGYNTGGPDAGSRNTFLGTEAGVLTCATEPLHNATAIGYGARVATSNALVLGEGANVGIGTSAPTARLHIRADQPNESGLRFENLTNCSPARLNTDTFLSVNAAGEVVQARYRLRLNTESDWADRVFAPGYRLRSLPEVAAFVAEKQHLPGIPSARQVVAEGIDAAQFNAQLLEKIEELTLYVIDLKTENQRQSDRIRRLETRQRTRR